jgi:uncharacterized phiE125 gp8 family phage protein
MHRILLAGPALEPIPLAEMKLHLRVGDDAEDALIGAFIAAARVAVETDIRRVMITQNWRAIVDGWPRDGVVLPILPALSLDAVHGLDSAGVATTLPSEASAFDAADGSVRLIQPLPGSVRYEIDFTAGYGATAADVPQPLRQAIRLLVTHWYENRAAVVIGDAITHLPLGCRELVAPYRRMSLC